MVQQTKIGLGMIALSLGGLLMPRIAEGGGSPRPDSETKPVPKPTAPLRSKHWAFNPPINPRIPTIRHVEWVRTPVDAFILARLERAGIAPPPSADRRTLLRRVYLDLIGIPPTLDEQSKFLDDRSPNAWEKVVDDLLARPQYGERWGRHWLDTVRYAETNGYERDTPKRSAWRYRDWVIDSFNADKPFARFIQEQIAGDELRGSNAESQIGASFLRLGTWDDEPPDRELDRYDQLDDVLGTTATAFLGITLRCARCHDHKFEPFTQKDYYRLLSVFAPLRRPGGDEDRLVGTEGELKAYADSMKRADEEVAGQEQLAEPVRAGIRARLFGEKKSKLPPDAIAAFMVAPDKRNDAQKDLVRNHTSALNQEIRAVANSVEAVKLDAIQRSIDSINSGRPKEPPRAYTWIEEGPNADKICILGRGEPSRRGEEVTAGVPEILAPFPGAAPIGEPNFTGKSTGRRLWLAQWLARSDNPLVGRVFVNRVWQHHFGEGLVSTPNDFGLMGRRPTHPELLDWLATEFVKGTIANDGSEGKPDPFACAGSMKRLHRLILLSNTYKATAIPSSNALKQDPENQLYSRWRVRRLEAEAIRDSMLAVSGQLNPQKSGPSIYPKLPQEVLQGQSRPGDGWGNSEERQASRRSVYIFVKRSLAVPELEALDAPDTSSSCETRIVSTVAPQALTFLNGAFARQQAEAFAARLVREAGPDEGAIVTRAFLLAYGRLPAPAEAKASLDFLTVQARQIDADARAGAVATSNGSLKPGRSKSDGRAKALAAFCLVLLNSNEFFYTN